jgi:hypothetical protein
VLAVAAALVSLLFEVAEVPDWSEAAGACWPTEAFEFGAFGSVAAALLAGGADDDCVEFIALELDGVDAALELWAPVLLISELAEVEGLAPAALFAAALLADVSAAVAPAAAAPILLADGPELLLPAPQWSETIVTLLT